MFHRKANHPSRRPIKMASLIIKKPRHFGVVFYESGKNQWFWTLITVIWSLKQVSGFRFHMNRPTPKHVGKMACNGKFSQFICSQRRKSWFLLSFSWQFLKHWFMTKIINSLKWAVSFTKSSVCFLTIFIVNLCGRPPGVYLNPEIHPKNIKSNLRYWH